MSTRVEAQRVASSGKLWAFVPVLILGGMFAGWGIMLSYALDDPSFGVEPDYYQTAVAFDQHQAQEQENQRLGYRLEAEARPTSHGRATLTVRVADRLGRPVAHARVALVTFHLARSSHMIEAELREREPGVFSGQLAMDRPGLWELRFRVERSGELFTHVTRLELGGSAP